MARPYCPNCLRPLKTCLCNLVERVDNPTPVLILQHPLEEKQAKGTARLLHLSLANSQLVVGEYFCLADLPLLPNHQPVLLYPGSPEPDTNSPEPDTNSPEPDTNSPEPDTNAPEPDVESIVATASQQHKLLIVLDGTWRKTRKMLHLSPELAQLPRFNLESLPASNYRIRQAEKAGQLSTLEAAIAALTQLEGDADFYQPVLTSFDQFVEKTWQRMQPDSPPAS